MNPYIPQPDGPPARSGVLSRLPGRATLEYIKVAVEVLFLLLAVPWIVRELARNPRRASRRAAAKHLSGS